MRVDNDREAGSPKLAQLMSTVFGHHVAVPPDRFPAPSPPQIKPERPLLIVYMHRIHNREVGSSTNSKKWEQEQIVSEYVEMGCM